MQASNLKALFTSLNLSETEGMNLLQENGFISDHCVTVDDIATADLQIFKGIDAKLFNHPRKFIAYIRIRMGLSQTYSRDAVSRLTEDENNMLMALIERRPNIEQEWCELKRFKTKLPTFPGFPDSLHALLYRWSKTLDRARFNRGEVKIRKLDEPAIPYHIRNPEHIAGPLLQALKDSVNENNTTQGMANNGS